MKKFLLSDVGINDFRFSIIYLRPFRLEIQKKPSSVCAEFFVDYEAKKIGTLSAIPKPWSVLQIRDGLKKKVICAHQLLIKFQRTQL